MFTIAADAGLISIFLLIAIVASYLIWQAIFRPERLIFENNVPDEQRRSADIAFTEKGETQFPPASANQSTAQATPPLEVSGDLGSFSNNAGPPFIFFSHFSVEIVPHEIRIYPLWKNNSAAAALILAQRMEWVARAEEPSTIFNDVMATEGDRGNAVQPQEQLILIRGLDCQAAGAARIPIGIMDAVRSGAQRLFIWGYVDYVEFPREKQRCRRTEFAREMVITDSAEDDQGNVQVDAAFRVFGPHNSIASLR